MAKVPVPLEVQFIPELLVELAPVVIPTAPEVEHVLKAAPATAVGAGVIVIVLVEMTDVQVPFPVAVNVKVRLPAVISAALGV